MIGQLAGGSDGGTITQVFAGLAALIAAFGAWRINKRDNDAEELKTTKKKLADLQKDLLTMSGYVHSLRLTVAADHGVTTPEPPRLLSEDW